MTNHKLGFYIATMVYGERTTDNMIHMLVKFHLISWSYEIACFISY